MNSCRKASNIIYSLYNFTHPRMRSQAKQNHHKTKEAQQAAQDILQGIISEITAPPIQIKNPDMTQHLSFTFVPSFNLHQGKCYQQFSPNLCGYHAIFNSFCFMKMFSGSTSDYNIQSGASFWKFKMMIEKFLFQVKRKHKIAEEWPWRDQDIHTGDYERTYNKICMEQFSEFQIFHNHADFYYLNHTWSFQYQNLLFQNDTKKQLNRKIKQFQQYTGKKPLIFHLMMGVTTHWVTFFAVKIGKQTQYWFFDSHNNLYLDWDWQQIASYIEKKSKDRTKYGKPEFSNFQKQAYSMCIKDIQTSLRLIIDCLEGKQTIDSYIYNQKFSLFAQPLQAAMAADLESASIVIREYQYNIQAFFGEKVQWGLLSNKNTHLMKQITQLGNRMRNFSPEGKFLHSLTKQKFGCF